MEKQPRATSPSIHFLQERGAHYGIYTIHPRTLLECWPPLVLRLLRNRIRRRGAVRPTIENSRLRRYRPRRQASPAEPGSADGIRLPYFGDDLRQHRSPTHNFAGASAASWDARSRRLGRHQDPSNDHRSTGSRPGRCSPSIVFGRCNEGHLCCTTWPVIACS